MGPPISSPPIPSWTFPAGDGPVVMVAPSTAVTGTKGLAELALSELIPGQTLPSGARVVVSMLADGGLSIPPLGDSRPGPPGHSASGADVVVCGGRHGMLSKVLLAQAPLVVVPGGGDQWELANRVVRQGSGRLIRPLTGSALIAG